MVSASDYSGKSGIHAASSSTSSGPKKRRFKIFAALAAPFTDMDERALHKKRARTEVRNNSKGNVLPTRAAGPTKMSAKRFPRGED
jgi:hypothetical protein